MTKVFYISAIKMRRRTNAQQKMRGAASRKHFVLHQHLAVDTDAAPQSLTFASVDRSTPQEYRVL